MTSNREYIIKTTNYNECKFYQDAALAMSPLFIFLMILLTHIAVAYTRGFYKGILEYRRRKTNEQ